MKLDQNDNRKINMSHLNQSKTFDCDWNGNRHLLVVNYYDDATLSSAEVCIDCFDNPGDMPDEMLEAAYDFFNNTKNFFNTADGSLVKLN